MKRTLVTGGSGFIGTNLVTALVERGDEVLNVDLRPPQLEAHRPLWREVDILDHERLTAAFAELRPERCVHLAAEVRTWLKEPESFRANTDGVRNVIAAAAATPELERILFASTKLVHGHQPQRHVEDYSPTQLYGESKVEGEKIVRRDATMGCAWAIFRPTSIWGPHSHPLGYAAFFRMVAKGRYFNPGPIDPPKSFGYVENMVHQLISLLEAPGDRVAGQTFYTSDYDSFSIRQWARGIAEEVGRRPPRTLPAWLLRFAARVGDLALALGLGPPPISSTRLANMWADTTAIDLAPMERISGALPFTMRQGVRRTVSWMRCEGLL